LQAPDKIKICHLTSVHRATDTRIFWKECLSLSPLYEVYFIAPGIKPNSTVNVNLISLKPPRSRWARFFITDWVLLFKAMKVKASLYHFHDPELIPMAMILKLTGKKIIFDVHEDTLADINEKKWLYFKNIAKGIYVFFERVAVRNFYLVLAEKSYEAKFRKMAAKYTVIQNYTNINIPATNARADNAGTIALVGMLSARRGLPFILDALLILKKREIQIRLKCIGEVNTGVKRMIQDSESYPSVKDQVDFAGYIPYPNSSLEIEGCLAGMALPENLPNHRESYPTKMFEYMAIGLPVVCSNFPLYKQVVEKYDCGIAVNPESPEEIANAIEALYLDGKLAKRMGQNAKTAVKNFNWETEAAKLLNFYKYILDKN
jgi:glycosyltransferase involved in cell wall biosynthesis